MTVCWLIKMCIMCHNVWLQFTYKFFKQINTREIYNKLEYFLTNSTVQFSLKSIHISKSYSKNTKRSRFYGTWCRYSKRSSGYCHQTGVGWLKSTNLQLSRCYIFVSFRNNVHIVVHYDNNPFWISADTNKDMTLTLNDSECPIHPKGALMNMMELTMCWRSRNTKRSLTHDFFCCLIQTKTDWLIDWYINMTASRHTYALFLPVLSLAP